MNQRTLAPEPEQTEAELERPPAKKPSSQEAASDTKSGLPAEALRLGVSVLIIGAGVLGMLSFGKGAPPKKSDVPKAAAALVRTVDIIAHSGELDIQVDGIAVPFREIQIAAEVAGRVTFKSEDCRAGNFVNGGTLLVQIDKETYELEVRQLERQKTEAEHNLTELNVEIANTTQLLKHATDDLELRNNEVARQKRLSDSRVGTTAEYEASRRAQIQSSNAKTTLENQQSLLTTRKARLETSIELAEIRLKKARVDLQRTDIKAPVSGVIVKTVAEADSFVQRGSELLTLEDTSRVEVRCSLTMDELYRLWQSTRPGAAKEGVEPSPARGAYDIPNAPVTVTYELGGRVFAWEGQLARYDGIGLNEKTRTVPCRVVVREPGNVKEMFDDSLIDAKNGPPALVRGMFVVVKLHTTPRSQLVRIPESAVRPGPCVWLVRDGRLSIKTARIAGILGDDLLVDSEASGIEPGEKAVVSPLAEAIEGMPVQESAK